MDIAVQPGQVDFVAARQAMVDGQLRPQGVNNPAVIAAMSRVPRERFVPAALAPLAYVDRTLHLPGGRGLPMPSVTGQLLTELAPRPGERALVIGASTGYSAAVLAEMGVDVTALDEDPSFAGDAEPFERVTGPLAQGWPAGAPYDFILFDGAVEQVPPAIIAQLTEEGRIAAALRERGVCRLAIGRRAGAGFGWRTVLDADVPILPGFERPRGFRF